jgi:hypothetical protein
MSNGDLSAQFRDILKKVVANVADQAHSIMLDVELEGIGSMRQHIDEAETEWGRARRGGWVSGPAGPDRESAGRRETDKMYDAVIGWTDWDEPLRIETTWGWEDPEAYYLYQEHGTSKVAPMEALHRSLDATIPLMDTRLKRIKP